jgi:hypothetical protein
MCLRLDTRARCIEHAYTVQIHHKAANQRRNAVEERQRSEVMDSRNKIVARGGARLVPQTKWYI